VGDQHSGCVCVKLKQNAICDVLTPEQRLCRMGTNLGHDPPFAVGGKDDAAELAGCSGLDFFPPVDGICMWPVLVPDCVGEVFIGKLEPGDVVEAESPAPVAERAVC